MEAENLTALIGLAFAAAWTPGPNNAMLASSGATFGFRRTLPHILGVVWGFPLMLFLIALGLGEAFEASAALRETVRWAGAAALVWIAWRTATAGRPGEAGRRRRPFTFAQAAAFQWVNPKAWLMAIAIVSQFVAPGDAVRDAAVCGLVFAAVGATSSNGWAAFGAWLGRLLSTPARLRAFNLAMAALILASLAALLTGG